MLADPGQPAPPGAQGATVDDHTILPPDPGQPGGAGGAGSLRSGADTGIAPVLDLWALRCDERGISSLQCHGPEATYLVTAVETALRRGSRTPHLGRASRSWGARVPAPGDAVAILSCLREVLVSHGVGSVGPGDPNQVHLVLDQIMLQAVDASSGNLQVAARTDPLTGCANRRALTEDLRRAVASALQDGLDLGVVAIDLDGLKQVNDTEGHAAGDAALLHLVSAVRHSLRESDGFYRIGGDEFVVLAPFTDAAGLSELMHRIEGAGAPPFSWGIASIASFGFVAGDDPHQLLQTADADLYERRRIRRNRRLLDKRRRRAAATAAGVAVALAAFLVASSELSPTTSPKVDVAIGAAPSHTNGAGAGADNPTGTLPTGTLPTGANGTGGSDRILDIPTNATPGTTQTLAAIPAGAAGSNRSGTGGTAGAGVRGAVEDSVVTGEFQHSSTTLSGPPPAPPAHAPSAPPTSGNAPGTGSATPVGRWQHGPKSQSSPPLSPAAAPGAPPASGNRPDGPGMLSRIKANTAKPASTTPGSIPPAGSNLAGDPGPGSGRFRPATGGPGAAPRAPGESAPPGRSPGRWWFGRG
jgi:diguanylate cyclase (GGDEF)-like protein